MRKQNTSLSPGCLVSTSFAGSQFLHPLKNSKERGEKNAWKLSFQLREFCDNEPPFLADYANQRPVSQRDLLCMKVIVSLVLL